MRAIGYSSERLFGALALGYVISIYLSSGVMRDLQLLLRDGLGLQIERLLLVLLLGLFAIALILVRHLSLKPIWSGVLLVAFGYGWMLQSLPVVEERFHLVQYGVLSLLLMGALGGRLSGWRLHMSVLAVATLAGIGDELVQYFRPNRVGDVRDVLLNTLACLLAQGLLFSLGLGRALPTSSESAQRSENDTPQD